MTLPDTQYYSQNTGGQRADTYYAQTQWIVDNRDSLNVAFVSHMGDIVQSGDLGGNPREWVVADTAMRRIESHPATLRAFGIPWGAAPERGAGRGSRWLATTRLRQRPSQGSSMSPTRNSTEPVPSMTGSLSRASPTSVGETSIATARRSANWVG